MNELFKNEIYIHMIIILITFLYTLVIATYILFNDEYNIFMRIISIFIIAIIIFLASKKETFLPFLGLTFIPNTLLCEPKFPNGANLNYTLDMHDYEDGTKIIYWAANKDTDSLKIIDDPFNAYKNLADANIKKIDCFNKNTTKNKKIILKLSRKGGTATACTLCIWIVESKTSVV